MAWYDELANEPSIIDCNLIDADLSGDNDCLVIDEFGEMSCINPMSGQWIWHIAQTHIPGKLNFPLVLPDINRDGVKDLLIACTIQIPIGKNVTHNALKLISGSNGRQIGSDYIIHRCSYIHRFQIDAQLKVGFNCIINDTDIRVTKSLREIYMLATNRTIDLPECIDDIESSQHKVYGQRKDTLRQRNIYAVNEKQLIVENYGVCPNACNVTVTLLEEQKGKPKILHSFNSTRMFAMVPARIFFNNTQDPSKPAIYGFVIKFWAWSNETEKFNSINSKRSTNRPDNFTEFNRFDYVLRKKRSWYPPSATLQHDPTMDEQRQDGEATGMTNISVPSVEKLPTEITIASQMRIIKETIVLIIFNSSDIRIENTSQSNIVQFCRTVKRNEVCQPDLYGSQNSVLIADLDGDQDGQELVSYYSTFVENENESNKWKLMTYVQLLRLESELPKLYAVDEKH